MMMLSQNEGSEDIATKTIPRVSVAFDLDFIIVDESMIKMK